MASSRSRIGDRAQDPRHLEGIARGLRREVIRLIAPTKQGYVQQGLGAADLFAALFFSELRFDADDPNWAGRDRFILSTAHNTAIFYAALAACGLVSAERVRGYCQDGSPFEINASERVGPCVEATCGSLGQGLSVGIGMALAGRRNRLESRVHVLLGDGELQEGQVWEALMFAGAAGLSNLCLVVDYNGMQVEGAVERVIDLAPLDAKISAFGWSVETVSGHDIPELLRAFEDARADTSRPTCIIAKTIAGKGVSALEGVLAHNLRLPADLASEALLELAESGS